MLKPSHQLGHVIQCNQGCMYGLVRTAKACNLPHPVHGEVKMERKNEARMSGPLKMSSRMLWLRYDRRPGAPVHAHASVVNM